MLTGSRLAGTRRPWLREQVPLGALVLALLASSADSALAQAAAEGSATEHDDSGQPIQTGSSPSGSRGLPVSADARSTPPLGAQGFRGLARSASELATWARQQGGTASVSALLIESGKVLVAANERTALNPASNAKLLTAAVALRRLGPDYRYTTGLYGRLEGDTVRDLVVRGHGDPSLRMEDLEGLCRSLVSMGLRRVRGRLLVDQSAFDDRFVPPAFEQQPREWASFRAPISAIAVDHNSVTLNVLPRVAGQPAAVWFDPPGVVAVEGSVTTRAVGAGQGVEWALSPRGSMLQAKVGGHVAEGLGRLRFQRRMDDPTLLPGLVLKHLLRTLGVSIEGEVAVGGQGVRERLVFHESATLGVMLGELGKESDNFYAEMVLKTLGGEEKGAPASSAGGAAVIREWLQEIGALDAGTRITNGSGLFDANRISTSTLTRVLRAAYLDPTMGHEFVSHLAIGGVDGTLKWRFRDHRKTRVVRAKTGTLAEADALGGYVLAPKGGESVAFAILVNQVHGQHREARARMDRLVEQLIEYVGR